MYLYVYILYVYIYTHIIYIYIYIHTYISWNIMGNGLPTIGKLFLWCPFHLRQPFFVGWSGEIPKIKCLVFMVFEYIKYIQIYCDHPK
jgi:hypothetical protein